MDPFFLLGCHFSLSRASATTNTGVWSVAGVFAHLFWDQDPALGLLRIVQVAALSLSLSYAHIAATRGRHLSPYSRRHVQEKDLSLSLSLSLSLDVNCPPLRYLGTA